MGGSSYLTLTTILALCLFQCSNGQNYCGDWETFKDEKCFKLLDNIETFDGAVALCKKQSATATLASILSQEEQDFLVDYVFKRKKALNSVWIGAQRSTTNKTTFIWDDGHRFDYSNFDKDDKQNPGDDCVEMLPDEPFYADSKLGKWIDVQCTANKKNQVLCQFGQNWPLDKLVKTFLDFRKDFVDMSVKTRHLVDNPVPLNFTYVQLPNQPEPSVLWPQVKWEDVSAAYAGLFFRVLGGTSEKFGTVQPDSSPRLMSVEAVEVAKSAVRPAKVDVPVNGDLSAQIFVGSSPAVATQALDDFLKFKLSVTEVRPRNQAVKVWRRIN